MFKVLIADDEQYIRKGIADHIDWDKIGCEIVGLAGDGEEAFEIVKEKQPHVIITDIMMPIMTGLELVEKVREDYPDTYIIIISGYDEFNYVQQALKLGAEDYILKPIDLEYLSEYVYKLRKDYLEKVQKEEEYTDLKDKVSESAPVIKGQIIKDIVYERVPPEDGILLLGKYDKVNDNDQHVIVVAQVDDYKSDQKEKFNLFLSDISDGRLAGEENILLFSKRKGEIELYIKAESRLGMKERIQELCSWLRDDGESVMGQTLTIAIGEQVERLVDLPESYKTAVEAMEYKFLLGKDRIIDTKEIKKMKRKKEAGSYADFDDKELVASIKFTDKNLIKDSLDELADRIRDKGKNSYIYTNIMVGSIYRQALQVLEDSGGSIDDVFEDPIGVYTSVISQETISGMIEELHNALLSISTCISGLLLGKSAQIEKAKDYIKDNYSDSELSLEAVAKYVGMSISYFSNNFKQEMKMTFVDYLTSVRIDKAKELLKKGYKSYEVSDMVGYNNPTYFSTVFKRVTGVTPSKYT